MKLLLKISLCVIALCSGLTACKTTIPPEVPPTYYPSYDEDYIYSVTYYGYRPYNNGKGAIYNFGWEAPNPDDDS